jgi:hypothetical protein
MGYTKQNGEFADTTPVYLTPTGGNVTEDAYGPWVELGDCGVLRGTLTTTAVSGSDALDVTLYTSPDGTEANQYSAGTFTQQTSATAETKCFLIDRWVRAHYNVTGSEVSIDVTLTGEAV